MWDERYNTADFAYGKTPNDFVKSEYWRIPKPGKVLCLAEGEGRNAVFLAKKGYEVTAVDLSTVGLQKAERLANEHKVNISTIATDLADYEFEKNNWDGIVSIAAHLPPQLRTHIHKQVVESLKPGGIFILEAYTPKHLEMPGSGGPPPSQKNRFMSLYELKNELNGLQFLIAQEIEREIYEGKYHYGESSVVQIVGIK